MNRLDRRREKAMQRKSARQNAKCEMFIDGEEIEYCECTYGKNKTMFRREQFDGGEALAEGIVRWCVSVGAKVVDYEETQMSQRQRLQTLMLNQIFFLEMIKALAGEAEGLDSWQDFDKSKLGAIAEAFQFSQSIMEHNFAKISNDFTPQVFCELVATPDDPENMIRSGGINAGLDKIKDTVFGNKREDRLMIVMNKANTIP